MKKYLITVFAMIVVGGLLVGGQKGLGIALIISAIVLFFTPCRIEIYKED
jgi:hypothetical protein